MLSTKMWWSWKRSKLRLWLLHISIYVWQALYSVENVLCFIKLSLNLHCLHDLIVLFVRQNDGMHNALMSGISLFQKWRREKPYTILLPSMLSCNTTSRSNTTFWRAICAKHSVQKHEHTAWRGDYKPTPSSFDACGRIGTRHMRKGKRITENEQRRKKKYRFHVQFFM